MTIHMVIDFNGYPIREFFNIKEYALCTFNSETGEKTGDTVHEVGKWKYLYKDMNEEIQNHYQMFFKKHGIKWETGTQEDHHLIHAITQQTSKVKYIFVRNKTQELLLRKFFALYDLNIENSFFSLDILGFLFEPGQSTTCHHHEHPYKNNCANDNLDFMFRWLIESKLYLDHYRNKMHMVVDFNVYYVSHGIQRIKEFACHLMNENAVYKGSYFQIIGPSISYGEKFPDNMLSSYKSYVENYYRIFGIEWNAGNCDFYKSRDVIKNYFREATNVYVRNYEKKKLLMSYIEDLFGCNCKLEIICLDEYGYNEPLKMGTTYNHHDNPESNNCAIDNSTDMTNWLVKSGVYRNEVRNDHLHDLYKYVPRKEYKEYY